MRLGVRARMGGVLPTGRQACNTRDWGSSGLHVSRLCLRDDELRVEPLEAVGARQAGRGPALHPARLGERHQLLRHRRHVLERRERGSARAAHSRRSDHAIRSWSRPRCSSRTAPVPTRAGSRASTSSTRSTRRCAARTRPRRPRTSSTAGIRTRPPRRRWRRCTTSSARQGALPRRLEHAGVALRQGPARRRAPHGWTRFVSMQNHYNLIYREGGARR